MKSNTRAAAGGLVTHPRQEKMSSLINNENELLATFLKRQK
jgi:hypothetical protein